MGLGARMLHETGNWVGIADFCHAFNIVKRAVVLAEVAYCVPALTPLVVKCYGLRPADVFFSHGLRGNQGDRLLQRGTAGGGSIERETSCLALRPGLKCRTPRWYNR